MLSIIRPLIDILDKQFSRNLSSACYKGIKAFIIPDRHPSKFKYYYTYKIGREGGILGGVVNLEKYIGIRYSDEYYRTTYSFRLWRIFEGLEEADILTPARRRFMTYRIYPDLTPKAFIKTAKPPTPHPEFKKDFIDNFNRLFDTVVKGTRDSIQSFIKSIDGKEFTSVIKL